jgi:hypothetical protein
MNRLIPFLTHTRMYALGCVTAMTLCICHICPPAQAQSLQPDYDRSGDRPRIGSLKNWLVVEVIERATPRGKAVRFADFLPVVVVDSATQTAIYARSGELIEIGTERTYYISVASTGERRFTIDGDPVQRLRAATPFEDDMVYQREFSIVYEGGPTPSLSVLPPQMTAQVNPAQAQSMPSAEETELARLKRDIITMRSELDEVKRDKLTRSALPAETATRGEQRDPRDSRLNTSTEALPQEAASSLPLEAQPLPSSFAPQSTQPLYTPSLYAPPLYAPPLPTPRPLLPTEMDDAEGISRRSQYGPASLEQLPALDCGYRVQFCATPIEREAERIRAALEQGGVEETSVELFQEPRRNITFYRVRGGCFASYTQVRTALQMYARTAERLRLGLQPMIVRN